MTLNQVLARRWMRAKRSTRTIWDKLKRLLRATGDKLHSSLRIIFSARISIVMVLLSAVTCLGVDQVEDAIIGFGNYNTTVKLIFFVSIGLIWALQVWYWPRKFFFLEYYEEELTKWDLWLIRNLPRLLGASALLVISIAFFKQAFFMLKVINSGTVLAADITNSDKSSFFTLLSVGITFALFAMFFFIFVYFRRKLFPNLDQSVIRFKRASSYYSKPERKYVQTEDFQPVFKLSKHSVILLLLATAVALVLLVLLTINPYTYPSLLGASISVLFVCFVIWLPILNWIHYATRRLHFPVFVFIFILVFSFSFFNGNKDVRIMEAKESRTDNIYEYFKKWYKTRSEEDHRAKNNPVPMIMVLSEGGGIRAAYWSACLLGRLQKENQVFSKYIFGIQGVSGGSFGATVFASLLKYYMDHPQEADKVKAIAGAKGIYQYQAGRLIGEDYLSSVVTAMFTRAVLQFCSPVAIDCFDYAKVFERKWELNWTHKINDMPFSNSLPEGAYSEAFTSLWKNNTDFFVPALFLSTTRVEDGNPFMISNLKLPQPTPVRTGTLPVSASRPDACHLDLIQDFYDNTDGHDLRISTATVLSARFPYICPAGTLTDGEQRFGFVDGGYYECSGANFALSIFNYLKKEYKRETNQELTDVVKPIVLYIKNGIEQADIKDSARSLLYQLTAPTNTIFQVRDAMTTDWLLKLKELSGLEAENFLVFSLQPKTNEQKDDECIRIPMGWTLSETARKKIDKRIEDIIEQDEFATRLRDLLPTTSLAAVDNQEKAAPVNEGKPRPIPGRLATSTSSE